MNHKIILSIFVLSASMLCMHARKIEKKIIIGRSTDCKGLAFSCTDKNSSGVQMQFKCNEISQGKFSILIQSDEIKMNPILLNVITLGAFKLEEDWMLPDDISLEVFKVKGKYLPKGNYQIKYESGSLEIIFL